MDHRTMVSGRVGDEISVGVDDETLKNTARPTP